MVRGVWPQLGGILGLADFLTEHGEAVESDLLRAGLRLRWLGSDLLTWRDLQLFIRSAPRESAIGQSLGGDSAAWSTSEHLMALLVDAVVIGNWQRQGDPHARRPDPLSRPGAKSAGQRFGADPIPISQFAAWWNSTT